MKKLIIALVAIAFISCGKDEVSKGQLDPTAMIKIRQAGYASKAPSHVKATASTHLSALEIVKQCTQIAFYNVPMFGNTPTGRGWSPVQRDTASIIPALKMWGTDIINMDGKYDRGFIEATDLVFQKITNSDKPNMVIDTIAYIPNAVLSSAAVRIEKAYNEQNYTECYHLFDSVFVFTPITGAEWRELKRQNKQ